MRYKARKQNLIIFKLYRILRQCVFLNTEHTRIVCCYNLPYNFYVFESAEIYKITSPALMKKCTTICTTICEF